MLRLADPPPRRTDLTLLPLKAGMEPYLHGRSTAAADIGPTIWGRGPHLPSRWAGAIMVASGVPVPEPLAKGGDPISGL